MKAKLLILLAITSLNPFYTVSYQKSTLISKNNETILVDEVDNKPIKKYKNIILFIGDGMGHNQVQAARVYNDNYLTMTDGFDFTHLAYSRTDSLTSNGFKYDDTKDLLDPGKNSDLFDGTPSPYGDGVVGTSGDITLYTDSAAGGTALATGELVTNGRIAVDQFGKPIKSIVDQAKGLGKKAGVLTTDNITGATPASFVAHHGYRHNTAGILESMVSTTADLVIGLKPSEFKNKNDYYTGLFEEEGFKVANSVSEFSKDERLLGVLPGILPQGIITPTLADLTAFSLDYLDNDEGFFLMVEGADIDKKAHANQPYLMVEELLAFDRAIKTARLWAGEREDTLILITADHETGALTFTDELENLNRDNIIENMKFQSYNHSRALVRLDISGDVADYFDYYPEKANYIYDKYYINHQTVHGMMQFYM